eukprot:TRINITY_DN104130_c0_g1_i1.p1 TRINITY_DN104130_c0_g1~~TRINITY_DN104130_c0_g1_i1.p1  ORF type:complete len:166 (+),score=23.73 TRINITY_DN104130_c0_g1_i1:169-666(+)
MSQRPSSLWASPARSKSASKFRPAAVSPASTTMEASASSFFSPSSVDSAKFSNSFNAMPARRTANSKSLHSRLDSLEASTEIHDSLVDCMDASSAALANHIDACFRQVESKIESSSANFQVSMQQDFNSLIKEIQGLHYDLESISSRMATLEFDGKSHPHDDVDV